MLFILIGLINSSLWRFQYMKRTGDIRQLSLKPHQIKSNPQHPNRKDNVGTSHQANASGFSLHASSLLFFGYMSESSLHSFYFLSVLLKSIRLFGGFFPHRIVGFILLMQPLFIWTFMKQNSIRSHSGQVLTLNVTQVCWQRPHF